MPIEDQGQTNLLTVDEMVDSMEERMEILQIIGRLFFGPLSEEELDAMSEDAFKELAEDAANPLLAEGCNDIYRYLRRRNTATCQELRTDFTQTFMGVREYEGASAVPYESLYVCKEGESVGRSRLRLHQVYKEHRLKLNEGIDIPEDHLAFEMEFMSFLSRRSIQALTEGDAERALVLVDVQRDFLDEHILSWTGRFFDLAEKLIQTRFYEGVLKMARGFLEEDPHTLKQYRESLQAQINQQGSNPNDL